MATDSGPKGAFSSESDLVIRLRGLPWSATVEDVTKFLEGVTFVNGVQSIHFISTPDGRASGECFVELAAAEDVEKALAFDRKVLGRRYIEVYAAKRVEMEWVLEHNGRIVPSIASQESIVRLRGLPFGITKEEIARFLSGLEIVPNGITQVIDQYGRIGGEAFVEFTSLEIAKKALDKHKETLGHRYIEVFSSSRAELILFTSTPRSGPGPSPAFHGRSGPYDRNFFPPLARGGFRGGRHVSGYERRYFRGGQGGFGGVPYPGSGCPTPSQTVKEPISQTATTIHMRGLPFSAGEEDIWQFFLPTLPKEIHLIYDQFGRPSGKADVIFSSSQDALTAYQKDKQMIGTRYIELFLQEAPACVVHHEQQTAPTVIQQQTIATTSTEFSSVAASCDAITTPYAGTGLPCNPLVVGFPASLPLVSVLPSSVDDIAQANTPVYNQMVLPAINTGVVTCSSNNVCETSSQSALPVAAANFRNAQVLYVQPTLPFAAFSAPPIASQPLAFTGQPIAAPACNTGAQS